MATAEPTTAIDLPAAVAARLAALGEVQGWGLFNLVDPPYWLAFVLSVVLLDMAIYLQHVMFHAVPALWRLHRMHHAVPHFPVPTGPPFPPAEVVLSLVVKFTVIAALRPPAARVLDGVDLRVVGRLTEADPSRLHEGQPMRLVEDLEVWAWQPA